MTDLKRTEQPTDADEVLRLNAVDRDQLLERLYEDLPARPVSVDQVAAKPTGPWRVFRQSSNFPERAVCAHRWGWVAELCAIRRTRREVSGVFHAARKVEKRRAES